MSFLFDLCRFEQTKILLCGEIHGIKQNYIVYKELIRQLSINHLGIELENSIFHFLLEDISVQNQEAQLRKLQWKDGRINTDFISLLQTQKHTMPIFFFDNVSDNDYETYPTINIRDKVMADTIKQNINTNNRTLLWAGSYHTDPSRTTPSDMSRPHILLHIILPIP